MKHAEAAAMFNPHSLWLVKASYRTRTGRMSFINCVVHCASEDIAENVEKIILRNMRRSYGGKLSTKATRIEE